MHHSLRTLGLTLLFCTPLLAFPQKSLQELQKMYSDFLAEEGFRPEVDEDGDVRFKAEGKTYFIDVEEGDQTYFRVALPNIWPIESEKERTQCYIAADYSNAQSKVAKTYLVRDNIWVGIEVFVNKPEDFKGIFRRCLSALGNGVNQFAAKMREQQNN